MTEESKELIVVAELNPVQLFTNKEQADAIIENIRKQALAGNRDVNTQTGQENIRKMAYQVARSKTALDKAGKELVAETKKQVAVIDEERSRLWDALENLQKEVRQPLTEWEEKDKARIKGHEDTLLELLALAAWGTPYERKDDPTATEIEGRLQQLAALPAREWQEFTERATKARQDVEGSLQQQLTTRRKYEAEQAELERLRKAEEARQQKERDDRIAAEAAAKAKREAEEKAAAEEKRIRDEAAAKLKAEQEATAKAERETKEANERAAKAEADKIAAAEKAEKDKKEAAAKAELDKQAAVEAEAKRQQQIKDDEAAAERQREANKAHRKKINNEALDKVLEAGRKAGDISEASAKAIIEAIANGEVTHVSIRY